MGLSLMQEENRPKQPRPKPPKPQITPQISDTTSHTPAIPTQSISPHTKQRPDRIITSENPLPLSKTSHQLSSALPTSLTPTLSRAHHSSCRWSKKETSPRYSTTTMDGMPASLEEWRNRLFHVTEVMTLTEEELLSPPLRPSPECDRARGLIDPS